MQIHFHIGKTQGDVLQARSNKPRNKRSKRSAVANKCCNGMIKKDTSYKRYKEQSDTEDGPSSTRAVLTRCHLFTSVRLVRMVTILE